MIHSLSLYDNEEKRFFGRTYTSMEKKVRSTLNGTEGEEYIFIHLPKGYMMNDTHVYCVHESYLKVTDTVGLGDEFQCVGYGFFKLFNHKAETRKSRIYRGTPRDLIMNPDLSKYVPQYPNGDLVINMRSYNVLRDLKLLIPPNVLCGKNDVIPGLATD